MARRKQPVIPDALLDQLRAGADAKTAFDKDGLLAELKKALTERALNAEMDHHLETDDGHRRLAIIDLSDAGAQPMRLSDDPLDPIITFNGEIYNYM